MRGLAAQHLLPGKGRDIELVPGQPLGKGGRSRVADRQPGPVGRDRVAIRQPDAAGGAVPGEHHIGVPVDRRQIGQPAIGRLVHPRRQTQLLEHIGDPAGAETLPCQHFHRPRAQQRPHRHLDRAGVRGRHDADAIAVGHAKDFARAVDGGLQPRLAQGGAVRAPQNVAAQPGRIESGVFLAGARGETRIGRPRGRDRMIGHAILPDKRPSLGRGVPPPRIGGVPGWRNGGRPG
jgi:hypothetical protein